MDKIIISKKNNQKEQIIGGEGIVFHNNNIVLGMQKTKRWYSLKNNKKGAIIKTIGGKVEKADHEDLKKTLLRETLEEIKNITLEDVNISSEKIFKKEILMMDLNPFDRTSNLKMDANFYELNIINKKNIYPNDLPFLFEIPIKVLINFDFNKIIKIDKIKKYAIASNEKLKLPDYVALFIPEEVKNYLKSK